MHLSLWEIPLAKHPVLFLQVAFMPAKHFTRDIKIHYEYKYLRDGFVIMISFPDSYCDALFKQQKVCVCCVCVIVGVFEQLRLPSADLSWNNSS